MPAESHIIILGGIDIIAGDDPGGCFGVLAGYMPTVEAIEGSQNRTDPEQFVLDQAELIASKFETSGFRPSEICGDTSTLGTLIEAIS